MGGDIFIGGVGVKIDNPRGAVHSRTYRTKGGYSMAQPANGGSRRGPGRPKANPETPAMRLEILQGDIAAFIETGGEAGCYNIAGRGAVIVLADVVYCCRRFTFGRQCRNCGAAPDPTPADPIAV